MNHEIIQEAHQQMRALKEHWWTEHQEPDPPPYLAVCWRDHEPLSINTGLVAATFNRLHHAFPSRPLRGFTIPPDEDATGAVLLFLALSALQDGIRLPGCDVPPPKDVPIERILFNIEGWGMEVDTPGASNFEEAKAQAMEHGNMPDPGDMERDFKTNPMSEVKETMTTYIVQTDPLGQAEWSRATSLFHKDDGGIVIWHEPTYLESESETEYEGFDPLLDVMCHFVTRESLA